MSVDFAWNKDNPAQSTMVLRTVVSSQPTPSGLDASIPHRRLAAPGR